MSVEELHAAISNFTNDDFRALVRAADGATIDALLDGVRIDGRCLHGNKALGKGARGAKKLELERRLREVISRAPEASAVATKIRKETTLLDVTGNGPDSVLDVRALGGWSALRHLIFVKQGLAEIVF